MIDMMRLLQSGACFAQKFGDLSGIRVRHVVTGAPTIVDSPLGKATRFGGAADYVTLGAGWEDKLRFDAGTQDFSIVVWLRIATPSEAWVFSKLDAASDGWGVYLDANGVVYGVVDARQPTGPAAITDTDWHCVCFTVDRSGNGLVYVDGAAGAAVAMGGEVMATTTAPRIGARSYAVTNYFNGDIYSVVIFDHILTPAEVSNLAESKPFDYEDSLVSRWDLSNTNPKDLGWRGLGYDGTGTGLVAATDIINGPAGGKALEFDGTEYVTTTFPDFTAQMSYAGWLRLDSLAADSAIWAGTTVNQCPMLRIKDNGRTYFWADTGQASVQLGATSYDLGRWYHWALTFDEDTDEVAFYRDGDLVELNGMVTDYNVAPGALTIATRNAGADNMVGAQDDFRIYDTILAPMQVKDLWRRSMRGATGG